MEVRLCCDSDVDGDGGSEAGEKVVGEDGHHDEAVLEGGGFGRLVGVVGCEEEEEAFGGVAVVMVEGGGGDLVVGEGGWVEGGVEDVEGLRGGGGGG